VALPLGLNLMPAASAALLWLVWTRGGEPSGAAARPQARRIGG